MFGFKFDKEEFKKDAKSVGNDCKVAGLALVEMVGKTLSLAGDTLTKKAKASSAPKK